MKYWNKILLSALTAAMLLALPACGKDKASLDTLRTKGENGTSVLTATMQTPAMKIHYIDEGVDCSAALTPASDYIYQDSQGNNSVSKSTRPCDREQVCTVYSADPTGEVRLALYEQLMPALADYEFIAAANLPSLTVMAYPATEDGTVEPASDSAMHQIPVIDGRFTMLRGWYYYEVSFTSENGVMMYGFIGYHTDEYEYSETISGCCVEIHDEDPDSYVKNVPTISLMYREGEYGYGRTLRPYGETNWTYTNHAGTRVTRTTSDISPREQSDIHWIASEDLARSYEFEQDARYPIERITVTITPFDPSESTKTFVITNRKLTLRPEAYYEFLVEFANGQASYGLMTGAALPTQPHPKDDPAIDPELAKQMRADYRTHMLKTQGSSAFSAFTLDNIYVEKYFGTFGNDLGDIPVVRMGSDKMAADNVRVVEIGPYTIHFPNNWRVYAYFNSFLFDTLADSYGKGHLTDEDIYKLGCMIDSTFEGRYPTP